MYKTLFEILSEITFQLKAEMIVGVKHSIKENKLDISEFMLYYKPDSNRLMVKDFTFLKRYIYDNENVFKVKPVTTHSEDGKLGPRAIRITYNM